MDILDAIAKEEIRWDRSVKIPESEVKGKLSARGPEARALRWQRVSNQRLESPTARGGSGSSVCGGGTATCS
jgi:hypothetical protein